jgi:hypothetical protein
VPGGRFANVVQSVRMARDRPAPLAPVPVGRPTAMDHRSCVRHRKSCEGSMAASTLHRDPVLPDRRRPTQKRLNPKGLRRSRVIMQPNVGGSSLSFDESFRCGHSAAPNVHRLLLSMILSDTGDFIAVNTYLVARLALRRGCNDFGRRLPLPLLRGALQHSCRDHDDSVIAIVCEIKEFAMTP